MKTNKPFLKYIIRKVPYVTVKVGQSLDGKIALKTGESQWITQSSLGNIPQHKRRLCDGIMVEPP